jgi:integrase
MVPLIHDAGRTLRWVIAGVRGLSGGDCARPGAALLPGERHHADRTAGRAGAQTRRAGLAAAAAAPLPQWRDGLTPHVLRHVCASRLYPGEMDLPAIRQVLGHSRVAAALACGHVHATRIQDAGIAGQERAALRPGGPAR